MCGGLPGRWDRLCPRLGGILEMSHTLSNKTHLGSRDGEHRYTHTHTLRWDRGVGRSPPNVDLMTGFYELKQSAGK